MNNFFFMRIGAKCIYFGPVHLIEIESTFEAPVLEIKEDTTDEI